MMADMSDIKHIPPFYLLLIFGLVASVFIFKFVLQVWNRWTLEQNRRELERNRRNDLLDAKARAQRWIDRLGSEIMMAAPEGKEAKQLVGLASQRHAGALGQINSAQTVAQATVAQDVALEGLYYMRDARTLMGELEGPPLPELGS